MLDAGYWMLDLRCLPGGIFAVAGNILMLDIRCWSERSGDPETSGILDGEDLFPLRKAC